MKRNVQQMSVEQAMFMADNNADLAAVMMGYNERGAYMERREYRQAAESVRSARRSAWPAGRSEGLMPQERCFNKCVCAQ